VGLRLGLAGRRARRAGQTGGRDRLSRLRQGREAEAVSVRRPPAWAEGGGQEEGAGEGEGEETKKGDKEKRGALSLEM